MKEKCKKCPNYERIKLGQMDEDEVCYLCPNNDTIEKDLEVLEILRKSVVWDNGYSICFETDNEKVREWLENENN